MAIYKKKTTFGWISGLFLLHLLLGNLKQDLVKIPVENVPKWPKTCLNTFAKIRRTKASIPYYNNSTSTFRPTIQLMHDVELNPGPSKRTDGKPKKTAHSPHPRQCAEYKCALINSRLKAHCPVCDLDVRRTQKTIQCSSCLTLIHLSCLNHKSLEHFFQFDAVCNKCLQTSTTVDLSSSSDAETDLFSTMLEALQPLKRSIKDNDISIAHTNIRGLTKHLSEIKILLQHTPVDFLAITETHLNSDIKDNEVFINGYIILRKDRPDGSPWGGCALYYKENLDVQIINKYMSDKIEAIWAELLLNSQRLLIGCIYRPPDDLSFFNNFEITLDKIRLTRKNFLITGDLNSDLLNKSKPDEMKTSGKKLIKILRSNSCTNLITKPTRVTESTKSIIDLIIVNSCSKVKSSGVLDLSIADHKLVYATLKLKFKNPKPTIRSVRDYKKFDRQAFQKALKDTPWWISSIFDDVDDVANTWELLFKETIDTYIPTRMAKIRKESLPWVNGEIRKEMNKRYKLLKKCDGSKKTSAIWTEYKESRNKVAKMLRKAEAQYWQEQFSKAENPQDFWKLVNKVQGKGHLKQKRIGPLQHPGSSTVITENYDKAELINDFFINVGIKLAE